MVFSRLFKQIKRNSENQTCTKGIVAGVDQMLILFWHTRTNVLSQN